MLHDNCQSRAAVACITFFSNIWYALSLYVCVDCLHMDYDYNELFEINWFRWCVCSLWYEGI